MEMYDIKRNMNTNTHSNYFLLTLINCTLPKNNCVAKNLLFQSSGYFIYFLIRWRSTGSKVVLAFIMWKNKEKIKIKFLFEIFFPLGSYATNSRWTETLWCVLLTVDLMLHLSRGHTGFSSLALAVGLEMTRDLWLDIMWCTTVI